MWLVDDKGLCCSSYSGISQSIEGIPSYDWIMLAVMGETTRKDMAISPAGVYPSADPSQVLWFIRKKLRSKQKTNIFWQQK